MSRKNKNEHLGWVAVGALVLTVSRKDDMRLTLTLSPVLGTMEWQILAVTTPGKNFEQATVDKSVRAVLDEHAHATWSARGVFEALRQAEAYAADWQKKGWVEEKCVCEEIPSVELPPERPGDVFDVSELTFKSVGEGT